MARRFAVLTGSGISAESGVPTFRGAGGLYGGLRAEELASPAGFDRSPEKVWSWYRSRAELALSVQPNAAHRALAELERSRDVVIVTQNVDGLHARAGSRQVVELHGSILRAVCERPSCRRGDGEIPLRETGVPRCACGARRRPAVVWFGESLPAAAIERAERAMTNAEILLVIGTSGLVHPAAALPALAAARGALVVEINPEPTPLTASVPHVLRGPAGACVPAVVGHALEGP